MISVEEALERLREGNQRFVSGASVREAYRPGNVAEQEPVAIVVACSDSRVPIELVFDQGVGDLFVIRVAGNVVASSQKGSIEYAVTRFGTPLVVVLGHSHCGAVSATLAELTKQESHRSPNLRAIVDRIRPAVEPILREHGSSDYEPIINDAVRANVRHSVNRLRHGSLIIENMIDDGDLTVVGAEYFIETGRVLFF